MIANYCTGFVLARDFLEISDFQYCTGNFPGSETNNEDISTCVSCLGTEVMGTNFIEHHEGSGTSWLFPRISWPES